ncbi:MAG TPA: glycoside hydrolase family 127 protein, partial [Opitutaceae bacterium]|nr:glycoside hydrolase family 127 protein [Opitutaceae bacterium]
GLDGHTAGHYLTALAQEWAASGDPVWKQRLDAMVAGLAECQQAGDDGYVGGIPRGRTLWNDIAAGRIDFQNFNLNGAWVPWYNEHKLFAGLRDAWLLAGNEQARDVLVRLADWCDTLLANLTNEQMQAMLGTEHGGMNEVLADVYAITGDAKYLRLAQRFSHRAVLAPLLRHEDRLTGLHANTQIPKIIGFARIAELGGDASWRDAARFFWDRVSGPRSIAFGGNSVAEHFNPPDDFSALLKSRQGPETCNTYNMLRLSEHLFRAGPAARYADYYERALYNHILASQHPEHGGYVYFTSTRPGHYRVYSQPETSFWCCVGSGMENHGKYGAFIYAHSKADDVLFVNLFVASELDWKERGVRVRQETAFPDEERTALVIHTAQPQRFTLRVRHPEWCERPTVTVNGSAPPSHSSPVSYMEITREWRDGGRVEVGLPMSTRVETLPDGSPWHAILHGPILLAHPAGTSDLDGLLADAGRMSHVAEGPEVPLDQVPVLFADANTIVSKVVADPAAGQLHFRLVDIVEPPAEGGLALIPFFRLHDARYQMYWETTDREALAERSEQLAAAERTRIARDAATIDRVAPGEQQSEVEHAFAGEETQTGIFNGRRWRHGRVLQYTLDTRGERATTLSITYSGTDSGRLFDIFANDTLVATQELTGEHPGEFVEKFYDIPAAVLASAPDGRVTIRLVAKRVLAGGIYDMRLLRPESAAQPQ